MIKFMGHKNDVFVFGSNDAGIHGAGAARVAKDKYGMPMGKSYGHYGQCFGIPTKDYHIRTLPLKRVEDYLHGFIAYAMGHRDNRFFVTKIGCGLAGFEDREIAPLFKYAPKNCLFDRGWYPILGENHQYWGKFD